MQILVIGMVWTVIAATCGLWVATLYKLLPLYRGGRIQGAYRPAFQFVVAALLWVTMQIFVWLFAKEDAAAMMLNIVWAIGLISWGLLSTVARTRRVVMEQRIAAVQPDQPGQPRPRYTVRTEPRIVQPTPAMANAAGGRSARAQAAMRRAVSA